jgi:hypothetical protein
MVSALLIEIGVLLVIQTLVMVWLNRTMLRMMNQGLVALDQSVATALKQLIEQGLGEFEPPNPILAAIASRVMQQPSSGMVEVRPKDDQGRFI